MLTAAGANAGVLRGLPCLLGVATGMGLMMFLVPLGLGSLVLGNPRVLTDPALGRRRVPAVARLEDRDVERDATAAADKEPVGYVGATAFQWVNPKSWLVAASAAGTFLQAEAGAPIVQSAWLGGLFVLAALPSGFVWLAFGATVQRMLRAPPAEDLQHRHGRAAGALGRPDRQVGRGASTTLWPAVSAASGMTPPGSPARIQSISMR